MGKRRNLEEYIQEATRNVREDRALAKSLLNNLCAKDGTRYLELGVYKASTLISAAYGNPKTKVVGIENFTFDYREPKKYMKEGWPNMKSHMYDVLQKYQNILKNMFV